MIKKFITIAYKKAKKLDKKATNPFLNNEYEYIPQKSIHEQMYIWVTKEENKKPQN